MIENNIASTIIEVNGPPSIDLIDCSSGGNASNVNIKLEPGYQVSFSSQIRKSASIMTGAVGLITEPSHAERILKDSHSDVVFLGREFLRNPYWPLKAEMELDNKNNFPRLVAYNKPAPFGQKLGVFRDNTLLGPISKLLPVLIPPDHNEPKHKRTFVPPFVLSLWVYVLLILRKVDKDFVNFSVMQNGLQKMEAPQ